jgi:hypothetical protein
MGMARHMMASIGEKNDWSIRVLEMANEMANPNNVMY